MKRNSFLYIFRFFLTMFMAVVTATLFLRTQLHPNSLAQGQLYFGVVFFSLIMLMFDGFAEMTFTILRLPGFYKQRGGHALHHWCWCTVSCMDPPHMRWFFIQMFSVSTTAVKQSGNNRPLHQRLSVYLHTCCILSVSLCFHTCAVLVKLLLMSPSSPKPSCCCR